MKYLSILLLLFSTFGFSQKQYSFDYLIEYEITFHQESVTRAKFYLTNSKDNSYFAVLKESDSLNFELILRHHNKIYAKVIVLKSEFYKAEFINIACENVHLNKYKNINRTKNLTFLLLKDTIINETSYNRYKLKGHKNPKKEKKRKWHITNYYIIDKSTSFHLPIFQRPMVYEKWKLNKFIPNGIFNQLIAINLLDEPHSTEKLQAYYEIDKKIVISKGCKHFDY